MTHGPLVAPQLGDKGKLHGVTCFFGVQGTPYVKRAVVSSAISKTVLDTSCSFTSFCMEAGPTMYNDVATVASVHCNLD